MAMSNYSLFSVLGIEIEYMLVDSHTLDVVPKSDLILEALAGHQATEVALGDIAVSNELMLHVLELKNNGPKPPTAPLVQHFQQTIERLQPLLEQEGILLLPTGAHPWMNPLTDSKRWPHGNNIIYKQYDNIFNCQGHGWANLQSMHINLPFANDEEFNQLHNAIRLILPLIPALAASTPFLDGQKTGYKDSRLLFYGKNQLSIPAITGKLIPEFISSEDQYRKEILEPMYQAIRPFDPEAILQYEWLNSRAAIPKFEMKAVEIRIIDSQECVQADLAIAQAIFAILKNWQQQLPYYLDYPCDTQRLRALYDQTIKNGFEVHIDDSELFEQWRLPKRSSSCKHIWAQLIERVANELDKETQRTLEYILSKGNLSERLLEACGVDSSKEKLKQYYRQLSNCLLNNQLYSIV